MMRKSCPGHQVHEEAECSSASRRVPYPAKMSEEIAGAVSWQLRGETGLLKDDLEHYLSEEVPAVFAVQRSGKFPMERPTGRKLDEFKSQLLKLHKASGHSSLDSLSRLLERRGAPAWAVSLAKEIKCPECLEEKRLGPSPPGSTEKPPGLWEILGMDVCEYEFLNSQTSQRQKAKLLIMVDRASRFCSAKLLHVYPASESWEPTTGDIKRAFIRGWMSANPAPVWILADAAPYFTSSEFAEFAGRSGMGLMVSPAESHWVMGIEERCIQTLKRTVARLEREELGLEVEDLFHLAVHGHNAHIHHTTGYAPYQWARGWSGEHQLPEGLDARKAFSRTLAQRQKAEAAFKKAEAAERLSRLSNANPRRAQTFAAGQLAMLWRQRMRQRRGGWTGPLRVLLQEGTTVWLATGATLVRAKTNQLRPCTEREQVVSSTKGMSVLKNPVGLDTLLRGYQGRHFTDASSEVPGREIEEEVTPAEVRREPEVGRRPAVRDRWDLRGDVLVRLHGTPRLTLFTPDKVQECPVRESQLTGKRKTIAQLPGGPQVIEDNYKEELKPNRGLLERWWGETHFELKPKARSATEQGGVAKQAKTSTDEPRAPEEPVADQEPLPGAPQAASSSSQAIPPTTLVVPGTPGQLASGVPLPEGLEEEATRSAAYESSSSDDSSSEEELLPEEPQGVERKRKAEEELKRDRPARSAEAMVACEIDVREKDLKRLVAKPKKATVWLSQKMAEKSKEVSWKSLTLGEKKLFDEAQAIELNNVLTSSAVRNLTRSELDGVDYSKVMSMRWVLTWKATGTAKARLVVLGYQAHNLTSVQTASPTLSRTGRHVLMACAANNQFTLESGDVTSAFLQTIGDLEHENLLVWAPAELAAAFGAPPEEGTVLKLTKAFYGLVHAPRKWFESVVASLLRDGWRQSTVDRCLFMLYDPKDGELVAISGMHVDDFLIAGRSGNSVYERAKQSLQETFRFGKWDTGTFDFAGCRIRQSADGIRVDQEAYVHQWVQEIPISKERANQSKARLTPAEIGSVRAALGTLAWKASQSAPHHQAEVSLLLSAIPFATVKTLLDVNKLAREVRQEASQSIWFPSWKRPWREIATIVWGDASQGNRPNKSSTIGYVAGYSPREILEGSEESVALITWRSAKAPRDSLGSNGSEVQAITAGEDITFLLRTLWFEVHGGILSRGTIEQQIRENTEGCLVTDSRGIYDAMTRNMSSLHGLRSSRAGFELTVAVQQALRINTRLRWVNGLAMLADAMTKAGAKKSFMHFLINGQKWSIVHDESFTAGKKIHKATLRKKLTAQQKFFVECLRKFSLENQLPWFEEPQFQDQDLDLEPLSNLRGMLVMSDSR